MAQEPNIEQVEAVERSLYNRMLKNAFVGFVKGAAVAAVIGLAVGLLVSSLPVTLPSFLAGKFLAVEAAAWFAGVAGSFGAVAGIQSTRDTRRYFKVHEGDRRPEEARDGERTLDLQPEATRGNFQSRLQTESPEQSLQR